MIVTFTPNPSIDRTLSLESLKRGEVVRARNTTIEAAGKGVNVAYALARSGCATTALVPVGVAGNEGFLRALQRDSIPFEALEVGGEIRTNISLVESDGTTTKINEPGITLGEADVENLITQIVDRVGGASALVAAGSLPGATPSDFYSQLAKALPDAAGRLVVDTSGAALAAMVGQPCHVLKPNFEELVEVIGRPLPTFGDVIEAAEELIDRGARSILISMGADGAILCTAENVWHAWAPAVQVVNTVGAGDSLLAGFLAVGASDGQALANGVAWGRSAVQSSGTRAEVPSSEDVAAVQVRSSVDRGRSTESAG